jgi:hypothetical protein
MTAATIGALSLAGGIILWMRSMPPWNSRMTVYGYILFGVGIVTLVIAGVEMGIK